MRNTGSESLVDGMQPFHWKLSTVVDHGRPPSSLCIYRDVIRAHGGADIALLWFARPAPSRYLLRVQWMMTAQEDNSGVFVAFPDPEHRGYANSAYATVDLASRYR
jgi:hypothetical protein